MSRVRWWSMYLLSAGIGYAIAGVLLALGQRFHTPVRVLVDRTARGHAEDAEHFVGPYLAPVTALVSVLAIVLVTVLVVVWSQ